MKLVLLKTGQEVELDDDATLPNGATLISQTASNARKSLADFGAQRESEQYYAPNGEVYGFTAQDQQAGIVPTLVAKVSRFDKSNYYAIDFVVNGKPQSVKVDGLTASTIDEIGIARAAASFEPSSIVITELAKAAHVSSELKLANIIRRASVSFA